MWRSPLLNVFPTITSGLRDVIQEPYSGSPGQVRLNSVLVVMPFARVHSSDLQSWSVTPVIRKCHPVPECYSSPHPMATAFGSIGAESNRWALGLCPIELVSTGGKSGVNVTAASTVRGSALFLLKPSISGPEVHHQARGPANLGRSFLLRGRPGRSCRQ